MSNFEIPTQLQKTLERNRALNSLVDRAIVDYGIWLEQNRVKFFAEYTDHSLEHVQDVLNTANELIRKECRGFITPEDVATLVLSTILHDCAMHLSIDGFIILVQSSSQQVIEGFNDKPWNTLWLDYLAESRRFSGRKLMALFGDTEPARHPPMNSQEMTQRDLLLCGEFLRRHHHRLAHEIAIFGVPGPGVPRLQLQKGDDVEHIIDLAGIVARSHGLSIRDCFGYLETKYDSENKKDIRGVHVIYIMALLRIADALQIKEKRGPHQIQQTTQFKSPVSVGEWEMHQAIKQISQKEYPETIWVAADPKNVKTFLRIKRMINQIQDELDKAWTAIGEIYTSDDELREFGLTVRRIRSNLDDAEKFGKKVPYIPVQASFEVADTDLLKLLIAPLYGDNPAIGIRELLQNAVDAVQERKAYQEQQADKKNIYRKRA